MSNEKRYDLGYGNLTKDKVSFPLWYYGIVVSNNDPYNAGRIKVRIEGIDNDIVESNTLNNYNNGGLPWCQPLMPKFINVIPILPKNNINYNFNRKIYQDKKKN